MNALLAGVALLVLMNADASAEVLGCGSSTGCGPEFAAKGWTRIAECGGHSWSYLLQKDGRVIICTGVSGRGGPIEFPCREFKDDVDEYRVIAAKSAKEPVACPLGPGLAGEAVK